MLLMNMRCLVLSGGGIAIGRYSLNQGGKATLTDGNTLVRWGECIVVLHGHQGVNLNGVTKRGGDYGGEWHGET